MYSFKDMIDLANQKWRSPAHKQVAINLLILNPRITKREMLIHFGGIINKLSQEDVESLTLEGAMRLGIPIN